MTSQASARAQAEAAAQAAADAQAAAIAAWCERSKPYAFFAKEAANDENLARCIPALFKAQAQKGAPYFSLSSEDITERRFSISINDPVLLHPETGMVLSNEIASHFGELPMNATAPNNRYTYLQSKVLEHYRQALQSGSDPYTGVKLKLHLSGIMDRTTNEMVPQMRGVTDMPAGAGWLSGFKSATLVVGRQYVADQLFSEEEYRSLHEYATLWDLISQLEGSVYKKGGTAKQRQYLTPKPGVEATFQFQVESRLDPNKKVQVPGMINVAWSGFTVLGKFSGGLAQETARPAIVVPQETTDMPDVPPLPLPTTPVAIPAEDIAF